MAHYSPKDDTLATVAADEPEMRYQASQQQPHPRKRQEQQIAGCCPGPKLRHDDHADDQRAAQRDQVVDHRRKWELVVALHHTLSYSMIVLSRACSLRSLYATRPGGDINVFNTKLTGQFSTVHHKIAIVKRSFL